MIIAVGGSPGLLSMVGISHSTLTARSSIDGETRVIILPNIVVKVSGKKQPEQVRKHKKGDHSNSSIRHPNYKKD